ncbi:MAG: glucose/sorbosone dehydrogenase-like protein [Myxococcales bacterium]|nr:glucose/sorbosone dehydrogenase-like protein [Myxococcales bacterium]
MLDPMSMRTPIAFALLAACGSNSKSGDANPGDGVRTDTGAPIVDAPPQMACSPTSGTTVSFRKIGMVSGSAVLATSPPNDGRLFVLEQNGRIRIFENEQLKATPFLDINNLIAAGGEQGLLGLTFHPDYAHNNYFYVFYTTANANVVARYTASSTNLNVADPASAQIVLSIPDFATNHNGGMMEFGSDGFLYVSTGDGGGGGDPHRNGQATSRTAASCTASQCEPLLGKILRIDVDHPANGKNYGIPSSNPFAGGGGEPEIFVYGLRNPWRWSFDRMTGDMWIGDVGQNTTEEIDWLPAGQQAGKNLGWSMYEANGCYNSPNQGYVCSTTGITPPVQERPAASGYHAIIGGQVYRGACYPDLKGTYFYSDNSKGVLSKITVSGSTVTNTDLATTVPGGPASLHADSRGELYLTTSSNPGGVYHLEAAP